MWTKNNSYYSSPLYPSPLPLCLSPCICIPSLTRNLCFIHWLPHSNSLGVLGWPSYSCLSHHSCVCAFLRWWLHLYPSPGKSSPSHITTTTVLWHCLTSHSDRLFISGLQEMSRNVLHHCRGWNRGNLKEHEPRAVCNYKFTVMECQCLVESDHAELWII